MLMMSVHHTPTLTRERFEEVVRRLTGGKEWTSTSDLPFDGLIVTLAGEGKDGFYVVDIFESEEAVQRFTDAVRPIAEAVGIEEPPEFFPAHTYVTT